MIITIESIKELDPCEDGLANLETLYPNYNSTLKDFISLKGIPYDDKIWLATKVLDELTLRKWTLACAESVVHIYNKEYPNDNRINDCLVTVRRYIEGDASIDELEEARSAAWSAAWSASRSAANSPAYLATTSAASSAAACAQSEDLAASVWTSARSVRSSARSVRSSAEKKQELNLKLLTGLL